ncbi:universal stress protein [Gordonia paraffinivorans]|uniref:Usp family protein n=1 Tax=Gordonia paraffinivorans NBRC 108238 TaxID=1223543 RepID=A0ABQ0IG42_9ACTN|nr:universal stress protein [Gordonia paraffinivorans]GAC82519.1 Usp family protein [Gordonia paraffinivorans NBRC 108238]
MRGILGPRGVRWVASTAPTHMDGISGGRPVVVGISGSESSRRALKAVVRAGGPDLVLVCAYARRREEAAGGFADVLKDEAYLVTGRAVVDEHLRTARELALWLGARSVLTRSEVGNPSTVLCDAARDVNAGAVVVGTSSGRPGWAARSLARRLDEDVELLVTDGVVAHRRRAAVARTDVRGVRWAEPFVLPEKGFAPR